MSSNTFKQYFDRSIFLNDNRIFTHDGFIVTSYCDCEFYQLRLSINNGHYIITNIMTKDIFYRTTSLSDLFSSYYIDESVTIGKNNICYPKISRFELTNFHSNIIVISIIDECSNLQNTIRMINKQNAIKYINKLIEKIRQYSMLLMFYLSNSNDYFKLEINHSTE